MHKAITAGIKEIGGKMAVSELFNVTPQCVRLWEKNGMPAEHVLRFCAAAKWKVKPGQVREDLYPKNLPVLLKK